MEMTERQTTCPKYVDDEITFAAIMQRLDDIHREVMRLKDQVEANTGAMAREREDAARSRRTIYEALKIIKEDADFYDGQFVSAFTRLGGKINGLAELATHLHEVTRRTAAGAGPNNGAGPEASAEGDVIEVEAIVQWRKPRQLPELLPPTE